MSRKIFNASLKSWILFFVILSVTLVYGLAISVKGVDDTTWIEPDQAINLTTDQMPIRDTEITDGDFDAEVRREVVLMGSQFVFIVDAPRQQALAAITEASNRIKKMELSLSSWRPGSDISRLNGRAGRQPVKVSEDTLELLQLAKRLSQATAGTFDVTVGAVWDIWPFRNRDAAIPSQKQIEQHVDLVDATSIEIDENAGTAYLPRMGMKVNLGAIGKGYAAEIAIERMKKLGIKRAAVSAGGDLYLLGKKTSGPWVVELEHPRWPGRYMDRFVAGDVAVATSGDAKQYVERDGRRYGHIIDPHTGLPANDCQSVTIVTQSSTEADAYATAVYVMGPEQGMQWVEEHQGVEALIVDREGRAHRSSGWSSLKRNGVSKKHLASSTEGM
jgi:thiamine biosynthesis lipoprotein